MYDKIERLGKSIIQHGKYNDRIYLMKLHRDDSPHIFPKLKKLAAAKQYSKIFAKVPAWALETVRERGYEKEAMVPRFYEGKTDAFFCSKYLKEARKKLKAPAKELIQENIKLSQSKKGKGVAKAPPPSYSIRKIEREDAGQLAEVYEKVFPSYPFPIFETDYLLKTMDDHVIYFGVFKNNRLVAASSAEMDRQSRNAEMTDFATLPEFRRKSLAVLLLKEMEREMAAMKFPTVYTIARSHSPGMN
ncbi:MAG: putative beta-lysine N-acetyltransferase, partial [Calditrichia bacterium]